MKQMYHNLNEMKVHHILHACTKKNTYSECRAELLGNAPGLMSLIRLLLKSRNLIPASCFTPLTLLIKL